MKKHLVYNKDNKQNKPEKKWKHHLTMDNIY